MIHRPLEITIGHLSVQRIARADSEPMIMVVSPRVEKGSFMLAHENLLIPDQPGKTVNSAIVLYAQKNFLRPLVKESRGEIAMAS